MATQKRIALIGVPTEAGLNERGCMMGPDALRTAGLAETLVELGYRVEDRGNVAPGPADPIDHANLAIHHLAEVAGWTGATMAEGARAVREGFVPVFLGGDHSMSAGSVAGVAQGNQASGRPQFVLWLDAHADVHTPETTTSGNLHGTPVAYFTGQPGFTGYLPAVEAPVETTNLCFIGTRSVDPAERTWLRERNVEVHDMRRMDQYGASGLLLGFLDRVRQSDGVLHVSFDVDFLDPEVAPAVSTTVPGGATFREAHLIMELLHESGLVTSLDLAELNPFLDERGKTAKLMVDLVASLFGRSVLDRPTPSY